MLNELGDNARKSKFDLKNVSCKSLKGSTTAVCPIGLISLITSVSAMSFIETLILKVKFALAAPSFEIITAKGLYNP